MVLGAASQIEFEAPTGGHVRPSRDRLLELCKYLPLAITREEFDGRPMERITQMPVERTELARHRSVLGKRKPSVGQ